MLGFRHSTPSSPSCSYSYSYSDYSNPYNGTELDLSPRESFIPDGSFAAWARKRVRVPFAEVHEHDGMLIERYLVDDLMVS